MKVRQIPIAELQSDDNNARLHSQKNLDAIAGSLEKFGQRKPIVVHNGIVIAGNGTLEAAKSLGWTEITITEVPENWDNDTAKAYALADNRTAELAEWNEEVLVKQLLELEDEGWQLNEFGFEEAAAIETSADTTDAANSKYTNAINIPQYNIVGEKPENSELFDSTKTNELKAQIKAANLPSDISEFLLRAAERHTKFNYQKIAEYYPHQTPEVQELMEASALVIIDAEDAIKHGYANFLLAIEELEAEDADE